MKTMKSSIVLAALGVFGVHIPAQATPTWWDSAQFRNSGSGTRSSTSTTADGDFWVDLDNVEVVHYKKTLYFVLDWYSLAKDTSMKVIGFGWSPFDPTPGSGYHPLGGIAPVTVVSTDSQTPDSIFHHHREYSLTLPLQPTHDYAQLEWAILPPNTELRFEWQFRSFCNPVPEPETYAMLLSGLGLLGFVARRRAH